MSSRRTIAVGVAAWLVVVAAGSGLVWAVISRAGDDVAATAQPSVGSSPTPAPSSTARAPRDPATGRQTWSDTPGYVTAACEGGTIGAKAQPNVGWRVEVEENGPREVEVEFESTDERIRYRVTAACFDGDPAFEVDVRDKG
jgi:hypothetical protein